MRNSPLSIAAVCCLGFGSLAFSGTTTRQAGLWEMTTTTTWQKSPDIPGDQPDKDKLRGSSHTTQICLTQEMINDYGALLPQSHGNCSVENRVITGDKITADYVCSGLMTGKGAIESVWVDTEHAKGNVHFVGMYLVGSGHQPIEWTTESTSTFKSSNCGLVKPKTLPKR
jgi:hypothetical protein